MDEDHSVLRRSDMGVFTFGKVVSIVIGTVAPFAFIVNLMINNAVEHLRTEMVMTYPPAISVVGRQEYAARQQDVDRQLSVIMGELSAQRSMWESIATQLKGGKQNETLHRGANPGHRPVGIRILRINPCTDSARRDWGRGHCLQAGQGDLRFAV